jgi:hypothetical protein
MADETYPWSGLFTDLAAPEQLAVAQLVVRGEAVVGSVEDLFARLRRARCLAILRETGSARIVAMAAWKQPTAIYRHSNFTAAGAPIAGFEAALELGYVVVAPDMRRKQLSGGLVDTIAAQITEPTFATTDSPIMRNNLERSGFIRIGNEWQGKKGMLSLWTFTP